jgi:CHAT domain-containing protein
MRNIPMSALHDGKQYLVQKYSIALTTGLELSDANPLQRDRLKVMIAGLSEARQNFAALPNVRVEINQISSEMPSKVLLDEAFNSTTLKNAINSFSAPIVHLATHGEFSSNAEETFILTWDDRINIHQLSSLLKKESAAKGDPIELLVLSACQTALGDNRAALGLSGVAVRAGARSTIGTLWYVSDEATSSVMANFYREFAHSTVSKAEALRLAQQRLLENSQYQHPYFWAPFILVGNWL